MMQTLLDCDFHRVCDDIIVAEHDVLSVDTLVSLWSELETDSTARWHLGRGAAAAVAAASGEEEEDEVSRDISMEEEEEEEEDDEEDDDVAPKYPLYKGRRADAYRLCFGKWRSALLHLKWISTAPTGKTRFELNRMPLPHLSRKGRITRRFGTITEAAFAGELLNAGKWNFTSFNKWMRAGNFRAMQSAAQKCPQLLFPRKPLDFFKRAGEFLAMWSHSQFALGSARVVLWPTIAHTFNNLRWDLTTDALPHDDDDMWDSLSASSRAVLRRMVETQSTLAELGADCLSVFDPTAAQRYFPTQPIVIKKVYVNS